MTLSDRLNLIATVAASLSFRGAEARGGNAETIFMIATLPDEELTRLLDLARISDPEAVEEMNGRKESLIEASKPCPICGQKRHLLMKMVDGRPRVWGACRTLGHNLN